MIHLWRLYSSPDDTSLQNPRARETFLYWFFDTLHRTRAPYSWPLSRETAEWSNTPAIVLPFAAPPLGNRQCYLTRFMAHVWRNHKHEFDIYDRHGLLSFLSWFAFEWIPAQNLPRVLLPNDIVEILNQPVRDESMPLTLGMLTRLPNWDQFLSCLDSISTATSIALSFQALRDVLRLGDPRLLPAYVTHFWLSPANVGLEMTCYEYLAAKAAPGLHTPSFPVMDESRAITDWSRRAHLFSLPEAEVFSRGQCLWEAGAIGVEHVRRRPKAIFVYRDHTTPCGQSRAGQQAFDALSTSGIPVIDIEFCIPRNRMYEEFLSNECQFCQADSAIHVLNLNPELVPECLLLHLSKLTGKYYLIGQFYWELSDIGSLHACGLSLVDEIWTASEYLKGIYARRVEIPIIVVGQAVQLHQAAPEVSRSFFGLPEQAYVFLFSFDANSGLQRKNPLDAALAFRGAFPSGSERTVLVIKTMNTSSLHSDQDRRVWKAVLDLAARDRRIIVIDRPFTEEHLAGLFEYCDCYVSLHRSEGFGYGPAEALARGKPVIATNYSGVTDFCVAETAMLVDYTLCEVEKGAYPYMDPNCRYEWASPNVETASKHMQSLYENPGCGIQLGRNGKRLMAARYTVHALGQRYQARLRELGFLEDVEQ